MSLELVSQFELLEHNPMTGKVRYGAWTELVEQALQDYIWMRQAGANNQDAKKGKRVLLKELVLLRSLALALSEGDPTAKTLLEKYNNQYLSGVVQ